MNKVYFVSKEVSEFLKHDPGHQLNLVNLGLNLFTRNVSKFSNTECIFRIQQEGALAMVPFMTKRLVRTNDLSILKWLISHRMTSLDAVTDLKAREQIDGLTPGCFVFVVHLPNGLIEAIVLHKFKDAVSTMVSKENLYSLQMRYLTVEEREAAQAN